MKQSCIIPLLKIAPSEELLSEAIDHIHKSYPVILRGKYQLSSLPKGGLLGTYAYSIQGKYRFIFKPEAEIAEGVLPGDVSRLWIRKTFHLPQIRRHAQQRKYVLPLLARTGKHGQCAYVDIRGAYRTVLAVAGWDVDYQGENWLRGQGTALPRIVHDNKRCYAMAISSSASLQSTLYRYTMEGITPTTIPNIYANRSLYALASEILSSIALDITRRMPCWYVNTDGYIVPSWCANYAIRVIARWGFEARIKAQGDCEVYGYASYKVGDKRTTYAQGTRGNYSTPLPTQKYRNWLHEMWIRQLKRYIL